MGTDLDVFQLILFGPDPLWPSALLLLQLQEDGDVVSEESGFWVFAVELHPSFVVVDLLVSFGRDTPSLWPCTVPCVANSWKSLMAFVLPPKKAVLWSIGILISVVRL